MMDIINAPEFKSEDSVPPMRYNCKVSLGIHDGKHFIEHNMENEAREKIGLIKRQYYEKVEQSALKLIPQEYLEDFSNKIEMEKRRREKERSGEQR